MILDSDSSQSSQTPSSLRRLRSSSIFVAARKHATDGEAAPDPALAVGVSQSCASPHLSTSLLSTSMWKRSSGEDPQQDQGQVQVEGENPSRVGYVNESAARARQSALACCNSCLLYTSDAADE